jgi:hypothetical protein
MATSDVHEGSSRSSNYSASPVGLRPTGYGSIVRDLGKNCRLFKEHALQNIEFKIWRARVK